MSVSEGSEELVRDVEGEREFTARTVRWLETVEFPGWKLMGEPSPSNTYVDVYPGYFQSIEENEAFWRDRRAAKARGEKVAKINYKWGV